ncbi:uncharacterized protein LOC110739894 [Chenopodium quinoa]|uniref:uncharacterized protein LOC110739894 n=1 Tax=Chenopodium quinoa TaxID=63459 RepID=UPI000B7970CA|nr:uncharacterized protein LOC110739894 [Chenopodium quinoa]
MDDWTVVQSMLVSWITNILDPKVRSTIGDYDDASILWTNLKNWFCVVSGTHVCQWKTSLGERKQNSNESVADYFGRLSKVCKELFTFMRVPKCACGKCTCNIVAQVEEIREEDYLQFIIF